MRLNKRQQRLCKRTGSEGVTSINPADFGGQSVNG
jgi:hypothetical protein